MFLEYGMLYVKNGDFRKTSEKLHDLFFFDTLTVSLRCGAYIRCLPGVAASYTYLDAVPSKERGGIVLILEGVSECDRRMKTFQFVHLDNEDTYRSLDFLLRFAFLGRHEYNFCNRGGQCRDGRTLECKVFLFGNGCEQMPEGLFELVE